MISMHNSFPCRGSLSPCVTQGNVIEYINPYLICKVDFSDSC